MLDLLGSIFGAAQAGAGWVNKPASDDYWYTARMPASSTGVEVDEHTAMLYATVFACVAKIAKTVATLPLNLYERLDAGAKQQASDHTLYPVLHDSPNREMDAVSFWESRVANTLLWGTGYSEIQRNNAGNRIVALWPLASKDVTPKRDADGNMVYVHRPPGGSVPDVLPSDKVLRLPGLSLNGLVGLSVIGYHRETVGLGIAATRYGGKFFANGAVPNGVLETPKGLSDRAYDRLKNSWAREYGGVENAHKTPVLEEDTKYHGIGMPLKDAQFLELREFQRAEVCGLFDVPPHKIGDLTHGTYSNVEEQNISWVVDCIGPWTVRIAKAINAQLLGNEPRYFAEHVLLGLLRGDVTARSSYYTQGRQWGYLSINDVRRLENMNPVDNGDDYLVPLNMRTVGEAEPSSQSPTPQPSGAQGALRPVVHDACHRLVTREVKAVNNAYRRNLKASNLDGMVAWIEKFYLELRDHFHAAMLPIGEAARTMDVTITLIPDAMIRESKRALLSRLREHPERIPQLLKAWELTKAQQWADSIMQTVLENSHGQDQ